MKKKDEQWKMERENFSKQKESELKRKLDQELAELQDQHNKVLQENQETLTEALKQAREKFSKEVVGLKHLYIHYVFTIIISAYLSVILEKTILSTTHVSFACTVSKLQQLEFFLSITISEIWINIKMHESPLV